MILILILVDEYSDVDFLSVTKVIRSSQYILYVRSLISLRIKLSLSSTNVLFSSIILNGRNTIKPLICYRFCHGYNLTKDYIMVYVNKFTMRYIGKGITLTRLHTKMKYFVVLFRSLNLDPGTIWISMITFNLIQTWTLILVSWPAKIPFIETLLNTRLSLEMIIF